MTQTSLAQQVYINNVLNNVPKRLWPKYCRYFGTHSVYNARNSLRFKYYVLSPPYTE